MGRFVAPRRLLRLGPIALCALTAHATLYRSVFPEDGVHGYFGWYEPLVAALSVASALVISVEAVGVVRGHRSRLLTEVGEISPTPRSAARLAVLGVAWLVLQESAERSLAAGGVELARFSASGWAVVIVTAAVAGATLTLLARAGRALATALGDRGIAAERPPLARVAWSVAEAPLRRRRALADRRGLRAPPVCA